MIEYEDFSIRIEPQRGDCYPVTVLSAPAGEGPSSPFRLPFDPAEAGDLLSTLGRSVRSSGEPETRHARPAARTSPQEMGEQLFRALFSGSARFLLERSVGMLHSSNRGLRIKLHIDPKDPGLAQLASLPWELLSRGGAQGYLNLSTHTPIVRYLEVERPHTPLALEPPLRILVVISSPEGSRPLDLGRERALIESSWAQKAGVEVEFLEEATILALQAKLAVRPYHVLHYMGHGDFDEGSGQGMLLMEDAQGQASPVDGEALGILLQDVPTLRLVFLNACETARATRKQGLDPFAGVATALVLAGIPAVVAMQFPISDEAAITYAGTFYPLAAKGLPVDQAVAEGRRSILLSRRGTMEWATPVLFMRAPKGDLFRVTQERPAGRVRPRRPILDREQEKRLEALYVAGLSAFWLDDWDQACHNFQEIVEQRPDYKDTAAKLAEAEKKWHQSELYIQAQEARQAGDWPAVLARLEELVAQEPGYKDAAALLERARRQVHLGDLYRQAKQLHEAGHWPAVIRVFDQLTALDSEYPDPDGLLATARREVEEQERQAQLSDLHSRAVLEMEAGRWEQARELLTRVQEMQPGYRQADKLLARVQSQIYRLEKERQRQEQIAALYDRAAKLAEAGQWALAATLMDELHGLDPGFTDPQGIAARVQDGVERLRKLEALYAEAQAAYDARDWPQAQAVLQALLDEDAGNRDAAALLARARQQEELAGLYARAQQQHEAGDWQGVSDTFARITALEPSYPDPQGLLPAARRELERAHRLAELQDLYSRAVTAVDGGFWDEAQELLGQVEALEPGYRDTEQLLAKVRSQISQASLSSEPIWKQIGIEMVHIPGGEFLYGEQKQPAYLPEYFIAKTPITNAQYRSFVEATNHESPQHWENGQIPEGKEGHPVIWVSWEDAQAFCGWVGGRLPAEKEWEKGARGTDGRLYPWGSRWKSGRSNTLRAGIGDTTPVTQYPDGASPYRLLDMAGNVWEWCEDWYDDNRRSRVLRGGAFSRNRMNARCAKRSWLQPASRSEKVGFRVVVNPAGQEAAEEEQQAEVGDLYSRAVTAADGGRWYEARELLRRVETQALGYRDTEQLLGQVLAQISDAKLSSEPIWKQIGIEMVHIPAGEFLYGEEKQSVYLPDYYMAKTPVTTAQYWAFVEATGHRLPKHWKKGQIPEGKEDHPVVYVSWEDAQTFCSWVGGRLPKEQEWEKGARGMKGSAYPWGNRWKRGRCNSRETGIGSTTPVTQYPGGASPYGLLDMAGNVWEWCGDRWDADPGARVVRGGASDVSQEYTRSACRVGSRSAYFSGNIGFRVVVDSEASGP